MNFQLLSAPMSAKHKSKIEMSNPNQISMSVKGIKPIQGSAKLSMSSSFQNAHLHLSASNKVSNGLFASDNHFSTLAQSMTGEASMNRAENARFVAELNSALAAKAKRLNRPTWRVFLI